jgi:hypothetical protein
MNMLYDLFSPTKRKNMTLSMYQASIPVLTKTLINLSNILAKGESHAVEKKIDPAVFVQARLYPDMYPLPRQVQIATDVAKGCASRLAGLEPPQYDDTETSFAELQARIAKTIAYLETFSPEQIDGAEKKTVTLKVGGRDKTFEGLPYLLDFVLPNVYFHTATAYAILRHLGVELGKADFLGSH